MNKFFGMFNRKEVPITLVQTWYLGLPNIARYTLWPILIGNPLRMDEWTFSSFKIQLQIIQKQMQQAKAQELQHLNPQPSNGNFKPRARPSGAKLTSIVSEGTREIDQEKSSYVLDSPDKALTLSP